VLRSGSRAALLVFGTLLQAAREAAEELDATLVDMRFVKPLDVALVLQLAASHELLVTVEENVVAGGAGSAVNEVLQAHGVVMSVLNLGLPDRFVEHGRAVDLLAACGLDAQGIAAATSARLTADG